MSQREINPKRGRDWPNLKKSASVSGKGQFVVDSPVLSFRWGWYGHNGGPPGRDASGRSSGLEQGTSSAMHCCSPKSRWESFDYGHWVNGLCSFKGGMRTLDFKILISWKYFIDLAHVKSHDFMSVPSIIILQGSQWWYCGQWPCLLCWQSKFESQWIRIFCTLFLYKVVN